MSQERCSGCQDRTVRKCDVLIEQGAEIYMGHEHFKQYVEENVSARTFSEVRADMEDADGLTNPYKRANRHILAAIGSECVMSEIEIQREIYEQVK